MAWPCFMLESDVFDGEKSFADIPVGAMWHHKGHLWVMLPGHMPFDTGGKCTDGTGWAKAGLPPKITMSPSIRITDGKTEYHGYIRNGVITDDVDGRKF